MIFRHDCSLKAIYVAIFFHVAQKTIMSHNEVDGNKPKI